MMSWASAEPSSSLHTLDTQTLVDTSKYYCPFLDRGFCRESACCKFSHDSGESTRIPNAYCHFFLANQCLYGQDCKFLHSEPDEEQILFVSANASFECSNNSAGDAVNDECDEDVENRDEDEDSDNLTQHHHDGGDVYNRLFDTVSNIRTVDGPMHNNGSDRDDRSARSEFVGFIRCVQGLDGSECRLGADTVKPENSDRQQQPRKESNQGPSSRLRATISHRCTITNNHTAHATSNSQESAQSSSGGPLDGLHITTPSTSNTSIRSSASSKPLVAKTWQGARLIASIRNNNLASNEAELTRLANSAGNPSHGGDCAGDGAKDLPLCPYSLANGECPFPHGQCTYLHGEVCDLCYSPCLHPYNEEQRLQHRDECLREHEREMELSFAVQRSKDKVCGVCMDTVVEKKPITSSRFGILEKCNHIFCLDCIRKWRGTKQFDTRTIRACPECRVSSDFVVPSKYWVEDQDDKDKLIQNYKSALRAKPCRYFNQGKGECPFAGSCFYRHAYPDGRLAVLEAPKPRRRLYGARGLASDVANYIFWNFINATDDDLSDDGVDSFYDWEMVSDDDNDENDENLDYGYDI